MGVEGVIASFAILNLTSLVQFSNGEDCVPSFAQGHDKEGGGAVGMTTKLVQ